MNALFDRLTTKGLFDRLISDVDSSDLHHVGSIRQGDHERINASDAS